MNIGEGIGNINGGSQEQEKLKEVEAAFRKLRVDALHNLNTELEEMRQKYLLAIKEGKSVKEIEQEMENSLAKLKLIE